MTREEAAKMIKDDIRLHHDDLSGKYRHALNIAIEALRQPEIIRCKDCKWFNDIGCAIRIVDDTDKPSEEDYCSFAERRTNEADYRKE